jgi:hypothetical protein
MKVRTSRAANHTVKHSKAGETEYVVEWGLQHRTLGPIFAIGVDEIQYALGEAAPHAMLSRLPNPTAFDFKGGSLSLARMRRAISSRGSVTSSRRARYRKRIWSLSGTIRLAARSFRTRAASSPAWDMTGHDIAIVEAQPSKRPRPRHRTALNRRYQRTAQTMTSGSKCSHLGTAYRTRQSATKRLLIPCDRSEPGIAAEEPVWNRNPETLIIVPQQPGSRSTANRTKMLCQVL